MATRSDSGDEDFLKIASLPPVENNSAGGLSPNMQLDKDGETADSVEVSFSETDSKFLEVNKVSEELHQTKENFAANISEISTETNQFGDDVCKIDAVSISKVQGGEHESLVEKKEQDSDFQRLLEAEKRRLLDAIEVGTIFNKNDDVDKVGMDFDVHELEKKGNGSKDNAFASGRSVKVKLVDDTAVLNVKPFYMKSNVIPKRPGAVHTDKDAPRKHKKIGEKQGKGNGKQGEKMYTRNQLESMRYANSENQKKIWSDMYARLQPELATEYESLVCWKKQKTSKSNLRERGIEEDSVAEEEYTEDNDDYNSILKPAFAVDGEPDFESGPPEDGLEYLRRVRYEAMRIPNVKVAKIDESKYIKQEQSVYMPQIPEIPKCPEHLLPVKEWEDSLLSDFLHLRQALSQNENECSMEEITSSQSIEDVLKEIFKKRLHTVTDDLFNVVVSEIQGMDSVTRVSKLRKQIGLVEKESGLQSSDCKWIVALAASVDTPLDADTCACLRALLRKCAIIRASLEVEDEQVFIMANMLITIAGRYFGQME